VDTTRQEGLKIVDDDDGTVIATRGLVQTNGESAAIYDWDTKRGKYVQKDRLSDAKMKRATKTTTLLTGISQHLIREVRVSKEQATMNLKLLHGQGKPLIQE
jgi:hypothetical protein